jgi:hypothetical protein
MSSTLKTILRFLLLLLGIQAVRALLICGMWALWHPTGDSITWIYMDMVSFLLVGAGLFLIFRPNPQQLGLSWKDAPKLERWAYILGGGIIVLMVAGSYFFSPEVLITNIQTVIILPIFEELLFRGWGWKQVEQANPAKHAGLVCWLLISFFFGIWHFGYMDIYILKVAPLWPEMQWGSFLLMKFLTTFVIGLVVGLPRWKTGRVYGSYLFHAMINLIGR